MSARRLPGGGDIERDQPVPFSFDGVSYSGFAGDSIAAALLAANVRVIGRSFKYHRPRGLWGAWVEEPNAIVDVTIDGRHLPNARATVEFLAADINLSVRGVTADPDVAQDRHAVIDRFARFIPAAFYYKTFMWPHWHRYEPRIRAMAGLGRLDPDYQPPASADQRHARCDVLVIGAGPAGLSCAHAVAASGHSVMLVDDQPRPGGSLLHRDGEIDGHNGRVWVSDMIKQLSANNAIVLNHATAYGIYDHNLVCIVQRHRDGRPHSLWRVRSAHIVIAAGGIERPLVFANNDRPGVMSADAGLLYLRRYAVLAGERIVIATNNDTAYESARALRAAGAEVSIVDSRPDSAAMPQAEAAGINLQRQTRVEDVIGRQGVEAVVAGGKTIAADTLLVSGGWTPTVHLYCQARGKPVWNEDLAAFIPGDPLPGIRVIGGARGAVTLTEVLADGVRVAAEVTGTTAQQAPSSTGFETSLALQPSWPQPGNKGRCWIDLQNDVTLTDIELAARENFTSVEHLKRYTTLGMATDQGKTSNINGLAVMAAITGKTIGQTGTTTYRPPYTPVSLMAIGGMRRGELFAPVRRLALETQHRAAAAAFREYGGWLRPAFYGSGEPQDEIQREAKQARETVALFDGSTLGKIEVMGPQAAAFVDFNYYNTMSTLQPGRIRYGFMLQESGVVYDDGVLARLAENHFIVSCSSSHVTGVHTRLEEWRQDSFDPQQLIIHNATAQWATLTATGPLAKDLVAALDLGVDLDDAVLPPMAFAEGRFEDAPARIARVSFTGDRSYEISVPASCAAALWSNMQQAGEKLDAVLLGIEALSILRTEKGYIMIGKDSDGLTLPHDLGITAPRERRSGEFIGKRSLFTDAANRSDRRQLCGLAVEPDQPPLATGAHGTEQVNGKIRSIGYVTSSYYSPTLSQPVALGLIERGSQRSGETITIQHLGERRPATIVAPCFFDAKGERLHA
jgi:sarcosine oxidase subunit alpha